MIKDNIKGLLFGIFIVVVLLSFCMALDSADEISNINESSLPHNIPKGTIVMNNSSIVAVNESASVIVVKHNDVIHTIKPKHSKVGMYAKPSCGCRYSYKYWYYREFVNYCPNCKHYNVLLKNPKGTFEKEWTCKRCSSDFCGVCGKEKYSWSRVYLRKP